MRDGSVAPIMMWFGAGVALLVVLQLIENPFFALMLLPLAALAYLGIAVVLFVGYVRNALKDRNKKSWAAAASIPMLIAMLVLVAPLLARFIVYVEFAIMLPKYSRIVEAVTRAPPSRAASESADAVTFLVDDGPPVRVAFPKGGIIDNWSGVIYDPSDAVSRATGWSFDSGEQLFTAPPEIRTLFGGDLVSCWRLYRHYYSCGFT